MMKEVFLLFLSVLQTKSSILLADFCANINQKGDVWLTKLYILYTKQK